MPSSELTAVKAFLVSFARRQAARTVDFPGGFAALDDEFAQAWSANQVVVERAADPEALPALVDRLLGHLDHRTVSVFDEGAAAACAGPLTRAGYTHCAYLVMLHTGPVPTGGGAGPVDLDALRAPLTQRWRGFLPEAGEDTVRILVDQRGTRRRGAALVEFVAARTGDGEIASWADLYADPATGTAQIEDLVTAESRVRRGHASAVLDAALRRAADAGCGTRFLIADTQDWPRYWYERRGFTAVGRVHGFERV
ncbi:GNAT family N-acetyltransferase [Streptomyces sp. NBC_00249]|uniref:GNAT family N-acetyltransferase n=1 Tax=Streptomyces sp. NBC_00249 TaxID=2975690 RepID=UPI0022549269|nr:GNAT family N-acetyltransferase [Streptomyces sp. NBC_00249]MCX5193269.1 GNAT family N-acetyltransferase [Streptomyces sp. NBC_00249]